MTSFPTTLVPTDPNAATTALGDGAKNHTDHHQAVDERLGDLQAALGLVDLTGQGGFPTLMDSSSTDYADAGWFQINYIPTGTSVKLGMANDVAHFSSSALDNGTAITAEAQWHAESDGATVRAALQIQVGVNHDGTTLNNQLDFFATGQSGELFYNLTDSQSQLYVAAQVGQTGEVFTVYDGAFTPIFQMKPDGSVGGVAPSVGDSIKWDGSKWKASA